MHENLNPKLLFLYVCTVPPRPGHRKAQHPEASPGARAAAQREDGKHHPLAHNPCRDAAMHAAADRRGYWRGHGGHQEHRALPQGDHANPQRVQDRGQQDAFLRGIIVVDRSASSSSIAVIVARCRCSYKIVAWIANKFKSISLFLFQSHHFCIAFRAALAALGDKGMTL